MYCCSFLCKHVGGCTGEELLDRLYSCLLSWQLDINDLMAIVTDSASNMNTFGKALMDDKGVSHHYCVDHIIHLTAVQAFSNTSGVLPLKH
jgi:hypothetical protein